MNKAGKMVLEGLAEAVRHAQGEHVPGLVVHVPAADPKPRPERILREQAAAILGVPGRTVLQLAITGEIPGAAKIGRLWTFNEVRLRAWVREREEEIEARSQPRERMPRLTIPYRRPVMEWEVKEKLAKFDRELKDAAKRERLGLPKGAPLPVKKRPATAKKKSLSPRGTEK